MAAIGVALARKARKRRESLGAVTTPGPLLSKEGSQSYSSFELGALRVRRRRRFKLPSSGEEGIKGWWAGGVSPPKGLEAGKRRRGRRRYRGRMALFYLVRHGESEWNAEERLCGWTDIALSDAGRRQAERLGERLQALPPTVICTSPLNRTTETAAIIARGTGLTPILDGRLVELNYGAWEGRTIAEVMSEDAALYRAWDADPASVAPPGGETGQEALARLVPCLDELKKRHTSAHDHVVVVTHKTACRLVACHVLGLATSEYRRRLSMANAALNVITPTPDGWRLIVLNDTSHLAPVHTEASALDGAF